MSTHGRSGDDTVKLCACPARPASAVLNARKNYERAPQRTGGGEDN